MSYELTEEAQMLTDAAEAITEGDDERALELINGVLTGMEGRGEYWETSLLEEMADS